MGNFKWYIVLSDKYDTAVFVKGYYTKEEALAALSHFLEEEPDYATFYTIRKEEEPQFIMEVKM